MLHADNGILRTTSPVIGSPLFPRPTRHIRALPSHDRTEKVLRPNPHMSACLREAATSSFSVAEDTEFGPLDHLTRTDEAALPAFTVSMGKRIGRSLRGCAEVS